LSVELTRVVKPVPLARGTLKADGSEQTLVEYKGVGKVYGSVDLQSMQAGDTVVLRQYVKVKDGGEYKKYGQETYSGVQALPIIYFTPKATDVAIKITLQQTAGEFGSFDYNFMKEEA
jgi:hypothetical protein